MIEPQVPNKESPNSSPKKALSDSEQPLLNDTDVTPIQINIEQVLVHGDKEHPAQYMFKPRTGGCDKLLAVRGVLIKQKTPICKSFTTFKIEEKYHVYGLPNEGQPVKDSKMFKCKEHSNPFAGRCMTPQCRGVEMNVIHKDYIDMEFDKEAFLHFSKKSKCSFMCFGRPETEIEWNEAGRRIILGKITDPCTFLNLDIEIYDAVGNLRYVIGGSCCQVGVLCENSCCGSVDLAIRTPGGKVVGSVKREHEHSIKSCCRIAANLKVLFPKDAGAEDRAMLVAGSIMLDFYYFERVCGGLIPVNCCCVCM